MRGWAVCAAMVAGGVIGTSTAAWGHAFLEKASPAVGATVAASPAEVKVWFDDDIQAGGCGLAVSDAAGKEVDKQDAHQDAQNKRALVVSLLPLKPGKYTVKWRALCPDSHKTTGSFTFTVAP